MRLRSNSVLICEEHIKNHSQLQRSHTYTKVFSEIREEARESAIKLFQKSSQNSEILDQLSYKKSYQWLKKSTKSPKML
ncbi:unnamed protein product [Blepharisma stoltei]|uniref:Uncharacterized protein n=1 Tax=Blepharisma stoltei TaxID=1481888 RepID=A0AAU9IIX7_9CILI|nr:unnamed protein product [Blepharisma stoltei]